MSLITASDRRFQAVLDPRRLIRWAYIARLSLAWAILIAAISQWKGAEPTKTLVATIMFVAAHIITPISFYWSDVRARRLTNAFFYIQLVIDLAVVTSVVELTDGQFAALYILVNAAAAIMLPLRGALLITMLGIAFYSADVVFFAQGATTTGLQLALQLVVFSLAGVGSSYISVQLKAAGMGREALAAELKRVQLRSDDVLENIRSGIISITDTGELLFANTTASQLLGTDLLPLYGTPILGMIEQQAPGLAQALRRAADYGLGTARSEGVLQRGELTVPLGVTTATTVHDDPSGARTITAIFQDISDQKRLEQLHLRAQRLEAVAELSASLAHEIKNPLASIRSAVEQIAHRPSTNDDERTLSRLIVRESDRLSRLLSEFLDFARVRVTRQEPVDVAAVVKGAARLAEANPVKAEGVTVRIDVGNAPLQIKGDEDLLHRAVFNLTLNALQATRPGTTVRVTAGVAARDRIPRGVPALESGAVVIEVADEGAGIDSTVRDRLFEPFTTTKPGGTGLGLAIAYRAIEAHRGVVLVDTGEQGTRFSVMLPLESAPVGAKT
jgi:two-component system sensor histidine kinase PilS (NtrC family)